MQIIIDSNDTPEHIRLVLPAILELAGIPVEGADDRTFETAAVGMTPLPPPLTGVTVDGERVTAGLPPPPPPGPIVHKPAEPDANFTGAGTAGAPPPPPPAPPAPPAAVAPGAVSASEAPPHTFPMSGATGNTNDTAPSAVAPHAANSDSATSRSDEAPEFDAAGLPWDGRIHQARKGRKRDGTWKIQKGADPVLVEAVVKELVARKNGQTDAFPFRAVGGLPPAPPVTVPVSVPPPPPTPDVSIVIPATAAPVPAPTVPPVGALPTASVGFRELIAKISEGTKANKLDPVKVASIVQKHGCPSLQALRDPEHVAKIPDVQADVEAVLLS